jgi:hypothetical protein
MHREMIEQHVPTGFEAVRSNGLSHVKYDSGCFQLSIYSLFEI